MARSARARIFRSTQTDGNVGVANIRDLETAFGTTANTATSAQYTAGGTVTWRRWVPNSSTSDAVDPATVSTASGKAWRDDVAQNANEQVRYGAGTFTIRVRLTKTGQTIVADIVVRVVLVLYRVTSAGVHVAELGRVQIADTTLSATTLTLTGNISTSAVTFNAGDKIQVEAYVTPITAGVPTAPAAQVFVNFVVDETSANNGASITAQPTYVILYARALSVTATGVATLPIRTGALDWPLTAPTKVIAGVTRNSAGAIVGSATVWLIRQSDGVRVATSTSHATTGAYSFTRGGDDPNSYRVVALKSGTPEIHGVTDLLVPV